MKKRNPYIKFSLMMAVSFLIMYAVMFLNVESWNHIYLSTTRTYMTILMIAPMAISMLLFMWHMYPNRKLNFVIMAIALSIFASTLYGLRKQEPIGDIAWMKAMIPHHSSAILTSSNANIEDPEVKKLTVEIIKAQKREIEEMKEMIKRLRSRN